MIYPTKVIKRENGKEKAMGSKKDQDRLKRLKRNIYNRNNAAPEDTPKEVSALAKSKFNRLSMRKVRIVAKELRFRPYLEAIALLQHLPQKSAKIIEKTLRSAGANAINIEPKAKPEDMFISNIYANEGPTLKRIKPRARGRADRINKRTSHLTVHVNAIVFDNKAK